MKIYRGLLLAGLCLLAGPALAAPRIAVVATTTDLQSIAEAVGGSQVQVVALVLPAQNAEAYEARPQDIQKLRSAQMVVRVGMDYDRWLDPLLLALHNPDLWRRGKGYVDASLGVVPLEVKSETNLLTEGHAHGAGNPHYWLDPDNGEIISANIAAGLERIDPAHAGLYEANQRSFVRRLRQKIAEWQRCMAPYQGVAVVAYHDSWPYFQRRFRLHIIGYIEDKPDVPPSPAHLLALLQRMQATHARAVIKEPFEPDDAPNMLAARTGARVLAVAPSVNALPQARDYLSLFDYDIHAMVEAFK